MTKTAERRHQHDHSALVQSITNMFASARYEDFDAGMHYQFYDELEAVVHEHGRDAIRAILGLVMAGKVSRHVLCPTLRQLGEYDHASTKGARFVLLTAMLYHDAPEVRDSAGLGLCDMGDKRAIPYLDEVIEDESIDFLRQSFTQARDYLAGLE